MSKLGPIRVMVVDDHEDVRFLISVIVGDARDVELVAEADGVRSALAQLDAANPDVIVLDAMMPVLDGYDAAPMIHAARPGVPILLCTAFVDETVRQRAAAAGIERVIGKDEFDRIPEVVRELARP